MAAVLRPLLPGERPGRSVFSRQVPVSRLAFRRIRLADHGAVLAAEDQQGKLFHEIQIVRVQRRIVKPTAQIGVPVFVEPDAAVFHPETACPVPSF